MLILDVTNTAIPALQWTIVLALITRVASVTVTMLVVGAVPVRLTIKVVIAISRSDTNASFNINAPTELVATMADSSDVSCFGGADGSA